MSVQLHKGYSARVTAFIVHEVGKFGEGTICSHSLLYFPYLNNTPWLSTVVQQSQVKYTGCFAQNCDIVNYIIIVMILSTGIRWLFAA